MCPFFTNSMEYFPALVKNSLLSFTDLNLYAAVSAYFLVLVFLLWRPRSNRKQKNLSGSVLQTEALKETTNITPTQQTLPLTSLSSSAVLLPTTASKQNMESFVLGHAFLSQGLRVNNLNH